MTADSKRNIGHAIAAIAALCAAMVVLVFIPFVVDKTFEREVEKRFSEKQASESIVKEWVSDNWSTSANGVVEFDVYGVKVRGECDFIPDWVVTALATVDGRFQEVAVEFLKDRSPGSTRPPGKQFFGRWRLIPEEGERIQPGKVQVMTAHDCRGELPRVVPSGPFDYPSQ